MKDFSPQIEAAFSVNDYAKAYQLSLDAEKRYMGKHDELDGVIYFYKGACELYLNKLPQSIVNLQKAINVLESKKLKLKCHELLMMSYYNSGNYLKSLEISRHVYQENPDPGVRMSCEIYQVGCYYWTKEYGKAVALVDRLLKLPELANSSSLIARRGMCVLKEGKKKLSYKIFKQALKLNKDEPLALIGMGALYAEMKKEKKALQYFQQAAKFAPGDAELLIEADIAQARFK